MSDSSQNADRLENVKKAVSQIVGSGAYSKLERVVIYGLSVKAFIEGSDPALWYEDM